MKLKTVKVKIDASTHRWLRALAKANSNTQLNAKKITPAHLVAEAAFCLADYAGRHCGSKADVGGNLLLCCGFGETIAAQKMMRLKAQDRRAK